MSLGMGFQWRSVTSETVVSILSLPTLAKRVSQRSALKSWVFSGFPPTGKVDRVG